MKKSTKAVLACALTLTVGAATTIGCSGESTPDRECGNEDQVRTCAAGGTLKGIDISYYQGDVDWEKVKGDGRAFGFARVSDGTKNKDSKFAKNWPNMKKAGLVRGAYQFFRPGQDAKAQAQLLLSIINAAGGMSPGDLPPVLDIETSDKQSATVVQARAKEWLSIVEKAVGKKPIVYTGANMSDVLRESLSSYTLWVANYTANCPEMPAGWAKWSFWQNSDKGKVAGVGGGVDTNFFNGSLAQLKALTINGAGEPDAGTIPDAGGPYDAGIVDSGTSRIDAGASPDAAVAEVDAGQLPNEPTPNPSASPGEKEGATVGSAGRAEGEPQQAEANRLCK